jgi:heat shock protein HtpX
VTTGLLRRLEPEELEGVLANELSHVPHWDVAMTTVASFVGVLAGLLGRFALYSQMFGGRGSSGRCAAKLVSSTALTAALSVGISCPRSASAAEGGWIDAKVSSIDRREESAPLRTTETYGADARPRSAAATTISTVRISETAAVAVFAALSW